MAKKKATPAPPNRTKNIFALRGSDEFKTWLDRLAEHQGMPVTVLVEQVLREKAERVSYPKPPRRVP